MTSKPVRVTISLATVTSNASARDNSARVKEGEIVVLNDFKVDLKVLCDEKHVTRADLARKMGITRQLIAKYAACAKVSEAYVKAVEALGYDVIVEYRRR